MFSIQCTSLIGPDDDHATLRKRLETIYEIDQKHRSLGKMSPKRIDEQRADDKKNTAEVTAILDEHGWLGAKDIGRKANITLFLVIQHSDLQTQIKYLPMMKEAAQNGKAGKANLALLIDRIAIGQNKKQLYGSQLLFKDSAYFLSPIEDPKNLDKRRKSMDLSPMKEYLGHFKLKWNLNTYLKNPHKKLDPI